jgi:hypothetical protein
MTNPSTEDSSSVQRNAEPNKYNKQMKNLIENRRKESNLARTAEFYSRTDFMMLQDMLTKAFNSGVSAQRDYQEAQRQEAMDKARELYNAQRDTEPVAVMDVGPGEMITIINGRDY